MQTLATTRVLVTGATGFIGRHLVCRLIERQGEVTCLTRASSLTQPLIEFGAAIATCDLGDAGQVEQTIRDAQPEIVFHVAGLVRTIDRSAFENVNAHGVETVAAACAACEKPPVLLLVSSLAAAGPSIAEEPRTEDMAPAPISAYGRSKLAGEHAARRFADRLPLTIVRPPIVFGPEDRGAVQMIKPIARFGVHLVPGRGSFRVSLVHVDDLVTGMIAAAMQGERATQQASGDGVYFLATSEHPTYTDLGQRFAIALGRSSTRLVRTPAIALRTVGAAADMLARLRGTPTWLNSDKVKEALAGSWVCSSDKARTQLGWQPAASLEARINQTIEWHRNAGSF